MSRVNFDVDHTERFSVPVVSARGIGDATVFAEGSGTLRQRMAAAGNGHRLVQNFVHSGEHSCRGDAYYPLLFNAFLNWVEKGQKPTSAGVATSYVSQPGPQRMPVYVAPSMTVPEASRSSMRAMTSRPVWE